MIKDVSPPKSGLVAEQVENSTDESSCAVRHTQRLAAERTQCLIEIVCRISEDGLEVT